MRRLRLRSSITAAALAAGLAAAVPAPAGAQAVASRAGPERAGTQARPASRSAAQETGAGAKLAGARRARPRRARCYLSVQPDTAPPAANAATACTVSESAGYTPCNLQDAYGLDRAVGQGRQRQHGRRRRPGRRSERRGRPERVPVDVRPRHVHDREPLLHQGEPGRRRGQLPGAGHGRRPGDHPSTSTWSRRSARSATSCWWRPTPTASVISAPRSTRRSPSARRSFPNSWGTGEFSGETGWDGDVDHPGVAITFSSGDGAYAGRRAVPVRVAVCHLGRRDRADPGGQLARLDGKGAG